MATVVSRNRAWLLLPKRGSKAWWGWLVVVILFCCWIGGASVYAAWVCDFISQQYVGRSGVGDSSLVVGRSGVATSDLVVAALTMPSVTSLAATNVEMVGLPEATLNGQVTDMGNVESANVYWQWGYSTSYGNTAGSQVADAVGAYTAGLTGFDPDSTVHHRFVVEVCGEYAYGADQTFKIAVTPGYWKITSMVPWAFLIGILWVLMKGLTSDSGAGLVLAVLATLVFFLVAINFLPTIFDSLEAMWGG